VCVLKRRIREVIKSHVQLGVPVDSVDDSGNLYSAGMTSHSSVVLMLALENEFGLEFPSTMLNRSVFESIDSIAVTLGGLVASEAA
jgi:acyl carrier protein